MIVFGEILLYTIFEYPLPVFIHKEDSMKYLVYFTPNPAGAPLSDDPAADNKAAVAYIAETQKKGTLETAYAFVTGGGIGILNVASHEELGNSSLPTPSGLFSTGASSRWRMFRMFSAGVSQS
jgi:hypothetical protein